MTEEKLFDVGHRLVYAALGRLRGELEMESKRWFETLQGFVVCGEATSYQQAANVLGLSLGTLKTTVHRLRSRYRSLLREQVARTVTTLARSTKNCAICAPHCGLKIMTFARVRARQGDSHPFRLV
jgi:hypothetical protein